MLFVYCRCVIFFFFFKQKTAYEMRISDWSSDVCSSDLLEFAGRLGVDELAFVPGGVLIDEVLGLADAALPPRQTTLFQRVADVEPGPADAVLAEPHAGAEQTVDDDMIVGEQDRKSTRLNSSH